MKNILWLIASIIFIWIVIMNLEQTNSIVLLDADTIKKINNTIIFKKILWGIMIVLEITLSYKLYNLILTLPANYKLMANIFLGIVISLLVFSILIFLVSFTSTW